MPTSGVPSKRGRGVRLDPRLIIGIVLVVGSVAGVWAIVTTVDDTVEVYITPEVLVPGERIGAAQLVVQRATLPSRGAQYLRPGDVPAGGLVVLRAVGEGEVISHAAVGSARGIRLSAVVVETGGLLPRAVRAGASVDLWSASVGEGGEVGAPAVIASEAIVVRLVASDSIVGTTDATAVELLIPDDRVARVIETLARGDALAVIPTGVPLAD